MNSPQSHKTEIKLDQHFIKGRGAQMNPANPFHEHIYDTNPIADLEDPAQINKNEYLKVFPKSIVNKVDSPDLPMAWSMNPYQGCEHGCIYCYARNTHTYWGYSPGVEFEQKIMIKENAPQLLEQLIRKPKWEATPIMLAGNTDCYQPAEQKFQITRALLKVFWKYRHPVGLITKNSLILRDLDLLQQLASEQLVKVAVSITTLDESLRQVMEPRTASIKKRLETIEKLTEKGIPVNVMAAPVIPGLTDHETMAIAKASADAGAYSIAYTVVRLNGAVGALFEDWVQKTLPNRADRILNRIKDCHSGQLNDSRFGTRMSGQGNYATIIKQQFSLAKQRYFKGKSAPPYNTCLHADYKSPQMKLF